MTSAKLAARSNAAGIECDKNLIRCSDCGLLLQVRRARAGEIAKCPRCESVLFGRREHSIERALALNLTALVLFFVANLSPFIAFSMEGREQSSVIVSGAYHLWMDGLPELGGLVFLLIFVAPLAKMLATLAILYPLRLGRAPSYVPRLYRMISHVRPWSMTEVYMIGVFVAYVKLSGFATLHIGTGVYAFAAMMLAMTACDWLLEPHAIWDRYLPPEAEKGITPSTTDDDEELVGCHDCDLVCRIPEGHAHEARCPRCGAALHPRKANSVNATSAMVMAAFILYIPANVFPVMTVISFGKGAPDTILSGVKELIAAEMWPLALVVFFASILVPMLKLVGLSFLLISIQRRSGWRPKERTTLYRIIESVGRWSMIDIFMISILVALVRLGAIATIEPGAGAIAFASVVIITMFAAEAFEPRLIWDRAGANRDQQ